MINPRSKINAILGGVRRTPHAATATAIAFAPDGTVYAATGRTLDAAGA